MEHLSKDFTEKPPLIQKEIVQLGLFCWSLIEQYVEDRKEMDQEKLFRLIKEKAREEGRKQAEIDFDAIKKRLELDIKLAQHERDTLESTLRKQFETEKSDIMKTVRLDLGEEVQKLREETIRLETKLEAQGDFQMMCRKLSQEKDDLKEESKRLEKEIAKLTQTKSSTDIGIDGEDEIETLLSKSDLEYENTAKKKGGHRGDFRIVSSSNNVFLLDSKKYTTNVKKIEKDKLVDDVDRDETVHGGLFISINSGIAKQKHGDIVFSKEHKPILFLSFMGMTQEAKFEILKLGIILLDKYICESEEKEKTELLDKIKKTIRIVSELVSRFKNIEKNAEAILENAKIGIKDTEILLREIQVK